MEIIMQYYSLRSVKTIIYFAVLSLLVSFSFCSICSSQGEDVGKLSRLIQDLKDKSPYVRGMAARALGETKDTRAIEPLIAALKDKDGRVQLGAAYALGEMKDARAGDPLIVALNDEKMDIVAGAYKFFIRRGFAGTEGILIKALAKYGTLRMAMDFLNCGNTLLAEAAHDWATNHGYFTMSSPGIHGGPRWGGTNR